MKTNVEITVVQTNPEETDDIGFTLQGRLIGACNTMNATKITTNWPVIERVLTNETSTLGQTISVMNEIHKETDSENFGHVIVALSALGHLENSKVTEVLTRQLLVSAPINLFAEQPAEPDKNKPYSISLECTDGSIITMEECKDE